MYIEHLDGKFAGQTRDIETSAALDLIRVGRARRVSFDAPAPEAPIVIATVSALTDKQYTALDCVSQGTAKISFPVTKKKSR